MERSRMGHVTNYHGGYVPYWPLTLFGYSKELTKWLFKQTNKQRNIKYGYWLQKTNVAKSFSYLAICINIIKRFFFWGGGGDAACPPYKQEIFLAVVQASIKKELTLIQEFAERERSCAEFCIFLRWPSSRLIFTFEKIGELRGKLTALLRMARLNKVEDGNSKQCRQL